MESRLSGTDGGGDWSALAPVAELARQLAGCRRASLMLPDDAGELRIVAASGLPAAVAARVRVRLGEHVAGIVAQTRRSLVSNEAPSHCSAPTNRYRSPSFISVPVPMAGEACGVLSVADPIGGRRLDGDDLVKVEVLAASIGRDLADSAREQQVQQLQEMVRQLRRQIIHVQEEERRRIARELHDEAGHALTAAIFQLDLEAVRLAATDADLHARLDLLRGRMIECVDTLHNIAFALRPRILEDLGLAAALRSLVSRVRDTSQVRITLAIEGQDLALDEAVEMVVFRVAQEALTNICKHARATRAAVRLTMRGQQLRLTIDDNGVGIGQRDATPSSRPTLGLAGMRERAELLGGTFSVGDLARGGTRVMVTLPLEGEQADD